jgi:hypothetical protein
MPEAAVVAVVADTELVVQVVAEMETLEDQLHTVKLAQQIEVAVAVATAVVQVETTADQELW